MHRLADAVRRKARSAEELVRGCLDRISTLDGGLGSFREVYEQRGIERARAIDAAIAAGEDPGPLAGVPLAVKDVLATDFGRTSAGSRFLEDYRSPFTATAVQRLENAGAIVIGKTNCDEFAMGSSTEHCAFGAVRNPWDMNRVPGGSSGGSAAAVAAGLVPAALGSDTGGSIRQPASFCNIVGLKPSYGRISRWGLIAFGSSLDQIGCLTRSVQDAALLFMLMSGPDGRDSTCADIHLNNPLERLDEPIDGLRVAVPRQYLDDRNDPGVNEVINAAIDVYRGLGAEIVPVELPLTDYAVATYYIIAPAEASANLARYDGIRYGRRATMSPGDDLSALYAASRSEGFGAEVQRRIMLGTYVLSAGYYDAYYRRAMQIRRLIKGEFDAVFESCHAILGPVAPKPAFPLGARPDPLSMYLGDVFTAITNIAGHCAMSIPAGFAACDGRDLPVGLHLQAKAFDEGTLLRAARMFEAATDDHGRMPPVPGRDA
jgi:aspartyl-tRNA(Asn)/glutamyl-tRNA(Gln) amidotransferase subunit A